MSAASFPGVGSPSILDAEAMVIREGVLFARHLGFQDVEVETNSISVVKLLKKEMISLRSVSSLISDIHSLALDFSHISFSHVFRYCNRSAHLLAKFGLGLNLDLI